MQEKPEENEKGKHLPMFERARELRRDETLAEQRLWSLLRGRRCGGLRFLRQTPAGHYVLDFFCPVVRLAIEVDGNIHNRHDVQTCDKEREDVLRGELHINVLRISNEDVMQLGAPALYEKICAAAEMDMTDIPSVGQRPARIQRTTR